MSPRGGSCALSHPISLLGNSSHGNSPSSGVAAVLKCCSVFIRYFSVLVCSSRFCACWRCRNLWRWCASSALCSTTIARFSGVWPRRRDAGWMIQSCPLVSESWVWVGFGVAAAMLCCDLVRGLTTTIGEFRLHCFQFPFALAAMLIGDCDRRLRMLVVLMQRNLVSTCPYTPHWVRRKGSGRFLKDALLTRSHGLCCGSQSSSNLSLSFICSQAVCQGGVFDPGSSSRV